MANVILNLAQKREKLCSRKRSVQAHANEVIKEIDEEIRNIDKAMETINGAISDYLCPRCKGTGIARVCDAAGQMEDDICPVCKGTGVINKDNYSPIKIVF